MKNLQTKKLDKKLTAEFWQIFKKVLKQEFTFYPSIIIDYFLNKIYTRQAFQLWIEKRYKTVLVASLEKNEFIGFAVIDRPYGGVSFCRWLGVLKEYQNKGVGTKLVVHWQKLAKKKNCHKLEVASQPETVEFYKKAGFKKEGVRKKSYFGITQHIFGKTIDSIDYEKMIEY